MHRRILGIDHGRAPEALQGFGVSAARGKRDAEPGQDLRMARLATQDLPEQPLGDGVLARRKGGGSVT